MKKEFGNLKEAFNLANELNETNAILKVEKKDEEVRTSVKGSSAMILVLLVKMINDIVNNTNLDDDIICEATAFALARKIKEEKNSEIKEFDADKLEGLIKRIFG